MFFTPFGKIVDIKCLSTHIESDVSIAWSLEHFVGRGKSWILTPEIVKLFRAHKWAQTLHES